MDNYHPPLDRLPGEQPDIEGKARFLYRKLFIGGIGEHPEMGLMKLR